MYIYVFVGWGGVGWGWVGIGTRKQGAPKLPRPLRAAPEL